MNFSKKTFLSAALLLAGSAFLPAADLVMTGSLVGDIIITDDYTIDVSGGAYTLNGSFLNEGYSLYESGIYSGSEVDAWLEENGLTSYTITITGGGTLSYNGDVGSGYYTDLVRLTRPSDPGESWYEFDSFWNSYVFYGDLVIGENTTLNITGDAYLVQYVGLYVANSRSASTVASLSFSDYLGVNSITLEAGATLSFEEAGLNLREDFSDTTSDYVNALQIIQNLYADADSYLVIGTDSGSHNRIVLYTGSDATTTWSTGSDGESESEEGEENDEESTSTTASATYDSSTVNTVGRLVGNGRFYVFGDGAVAFIGESELDSGSNNDTSGNTWIEGNRLADIILGNLEVYVGTNPVTDEDEFLSDSEALAAATDNVFAGATAVQLGTGGTNDDYTVIYSVTEYVTVGAAFVSDAFESAEGDDTVSGPYVTVYGDQIFNNFQSLYVERSNLLSSAEIDSDMTSLESEPVVFAYVSNSVLVRATGGGTVVRVAGGSVLTINQDEGRDGYYTGTLITHLYTEDDDTDPNTVIADNVDDIQDNGDGLIVKTGEGKIYYSSSGTNATLSGYLSHLRIEEGTWATTIASMDGSNIELSGTGIIEFLVEDKLEMTANIQATDDTAILEFSAFTVLENDISDDSLTEVEAATDLDDIELEYRTDVISKNAAIQGWAAVQVVTEQAQFYGTVVVNDGLTLILGDSDSGEDSPSIFSSAAGIVLNGADADDERYEDIGLFSDEDFERLAVSTLEIASGTQLVSNLSGEADHSQVTIASGATLVLTTTADSDANYYGGFSGNGTLIRFGGGRTDSGEAVSDEITINGSDLFGSLFVLSGSAYITQTIANAGVAALILGNNSSVEYYSSDGAVKIGALIGESGTTLSFSGTLTVGDMSLSTGLRTGGSYIATSNYSAYSDYFDGTSVESVLSALEDNVTSARGSTSGNSATYEDSLEYLANPAGLIYTDDEDVFDGELSRVYASTGTDHSGNDVYSMMASSDDGATVFGDASSIEDWLKATFTVDAVEEYINSDDAALSSEMEEDLLALATAIESSTDGVETYLDSEGNLNVSGWNKIVSAGGLYFLKWKFECLEDLADSTLYSFITYFYEDYELTLTQDNATLIASDYDLSSSSWFSISVTSSTGYTTNWDNFLDSFSIESTEFAGKISGSGDLIKTGAETLTLTGHNTYTGKTYIQSGELSIKWYAVQYTSGVVVYRNALLTIDANTTDATGEVDVTGDEDEALILGNDYGTFLNDSTARLSGGGVVLKTGDGKVDLNSALYDNSDGEFTGTFLVAEGELKATIDTDARLSELTDEEIEDGAVPQLNFSVEFSSDDESAADERVFTLVFSTDISDVTYDEDGNIIVSEDDAENAVTIELVGNGDVAVSGDGTFVLDAGTTAGGTLNTLLVDAANIFDPTYVQIQSGELQIYISDESATAHPTDIQLSTGTQLTFDIGVDVSEIEYTDMDISRETGTSGGALVVSADPEDSYDTDKRSLTLNGSMDGVFELHLSGVAKLILGSSSEDENADDDTTAADEATTATASVASVRSTSSDENEDEDESSDDVYSFTVTSFTGDSGTELVLGSNYRMTVNIDGEDAETVFEGLLTGDGTLIKYGTGTLVIGNNIAEEDETETTAFSGTIVFLQGEIDLLAGENVTLDYTGTSIIGEDDEASGSNNDDRKLVKDGDGTVLLGSEDGNYISVPNFSVDVLDGTLIISAELFASGDDLPDAIYIADGAEFSLIDMAEDLTIDDLEVTGTGTLSFDSGDNEVTVYVENDITDDFTGTIYISENITLDLGEDVSTLSGIAGEGTVVVGNEKGELTITEDGNADAAEIFSGTISGLKSLTVLGEGAFAVEADSVEDLTEVTVGSSSENGGFGVSYDWTGTIYAEGSTSRVLIFGGSPTEGTVVVGSGVDHLILSYDGTIELGEMAVSETFNLEDEDGNDVVLDGSPAVTLSNVGNTDLTLKNLNNLDSEVFSLATNEGGYIIFDGSGDGGASSSSLTTTNSSRAVAVSSTADTDYSEAATGTWDGDITGSGGISLVGANLTLTSSTLSYTGETLVDDESTLTYATAGTTSSSSGLYVESGGTVVGGVSLTADDSTVVFEAGSTIVFTGSAIEFTGSASVEASGNESTITVELSSDALQYRGRALAVFRYIGDDTENDGQNQVTYDKIEFVDDDSDDITVGWYRDEADDDAPLTTGETTFYLVVDDLASVIDLHDGLSADFVNAINELTYTDEDGYLLLDEEDDDYEAKKAIAVAIIKTSNSGLAGMLNNLTPLSYGAMLALPQAGFINDIATISARIEQRRYDPYASFIWETHHDWEFFAQAQGTFVEADDDDDTRTFDMDIFGAIAGADVKLSAESVAGFAIAYDYGKADIHNSGGDIESHDIRATAFFGRTFDARFYLDTGAQIGYAMYDIDRDTAIGGVDGDTTGIHAGIFANFGMLIPLFASENGKTLFSLMPYVGLAASYYNVDSFDEDGAASALDTDSFDAASIRATIGASLVWGFRWLGNSTRINLDFAYTHELMDDDVDIDFEMPEITSGKYTVSAIAFAEDTFSIGPRITYDLSKDTSIFAGYRFEATSDSDTAHYANIGFRMRF